MSGEMIAAAVFFGLAALAWSYSIAVAVQVVRERRERR